MPAKETDTPLVRCHWAGTDPLMVAYHDEEWGVPSHDDRHLFEFLTLEGAQAGLSWSTILRKREGYRRAFVDFDPVAVSRFTADDVDRLMLDSAIVRNRLKITSAVDNAARVLEAQRDFGSFDALVWEAVGGKPRTNNWHSLSDLPAETDESRALSRTLKLRGFRFVGPTTCYAFMQAVGMVDDHEVACFRRTG